MIYWKSQVWQKGTPLTATKSQGRGQSIWRKSEYGQQGVQENRKGTAEKKEEKIQNSLILFFMQKNLIKLLEIIPEQPATIRRLECGEKICGGLSELKQQAEVFKERMPYYLYTLLTSQIAGGEGERK